METKKEMESQTKKQRKRENRRVRAEAVEALVKGMAASTIGAMARKTPRKRRTRKSRNPGSGEVVVRRKELLMELKVPASGGDLLKKVTLNPRYFTWLKTLSKAFEKYQWLSLKTMWKPAVGTTVGGLVTQGIRWDVTDQNPLARTEIVAHTPNRTHAVWEDGERLPLVVPPSRLQTRKWYMVGEKGSDGGPGQLEIGVSTSEKDVLLGELWVEYSIRLAGTQA